MVDQSSWRIFLVLIGRKTPFRPVCVKYLLYRLHLCITFHCSETGWRFFQEDIIKIMSLIDYGILLAINTRVFVSAKRLSKIGGEMVWNRGRRSLLDRGQTPAGIEFTSGVRESLGRILGEPGTPSTFRKSSREWAMIKRLSYWVCLE